jgi:tetratricopeptide (TPR) repeat protein
MKHFIKNIVPILLAGIVVLAGCNDRLNITPAQSIGEDIALSTSENVQAALIGAYDGLSDTDVMGGNPLFEPDLLADNGGVRWVGSFEEPEQMWLKRLQVENGDVEDAWTDAYEAINIINNVLSALDVVEEAERDRVEGEALFLRGLIYFQLAELFGQPWSAGDQSTNLTVPIITEPTRSIDASAEVPRNTVAEVYNLVINDLTRAESLLPPTNGVFATSFTSAAILSRVYLQQGDFAAARDAADRVIASQQFSLVGNYADAFAQDNNTSEDIFAIQVSSQDGANNMNLFYAPDEFGGRGDIDILQPHLDLYEDGDERRALFFVDEGGVNRTGKWINIFGNIGIVRLAEMYLTRAEGNLEEGTTVGATPADDVNTVRNRAGLEDLSPAEVDNEAILFERRLELAFEGQMLHDIKRTQRSVGPLAFDAPELVYPVPQREIDVNPNLEQNAGY